MIKVCIVEDDSAEQERLRKFLKLYGEANGCEFVISAYTQAEPFIENYSCDFDIIFFDIELPGTDGMSAAKKIRERDDRVVLIFVTNVARLAIDGYSVQALDYIIKPIEKYPFFATMDRARRKISEYRNAVIDVHTATGTVLLKSEEILYIEAFGHKLVYHTEGNDIFEWAALSKPEKIFEGKGFARCHKCYLVNLRYVKNFTGSEVTVGNRVLKVSYNRAKEFSRILNEYFCK